MTNGISRKGTILTVDLSQWETQQDFCERTGRRLNTVSQWVKRAQEPDCKKPLIDWVKIHELNDIVLIRANENTPFE